MSSRHQPGGIINPSVKEAAELLPRYRHDNTFDSTKFTTRFPDFPITGYRDRGVRRVVTVPDVVGMPFHVGRDVAAQAGVTLANPDPDGPPISALAWPGLYYIVRQEPAPGTELQEWDSVGIEVVEHGDTLDHEPAVPRPSPAGDAAHATPEPEQHVGLTDNRSVRPDVDGPDHQRQRSHVDIVQRGWSNAVSAWLVRR